MSTITYLTSLVQQAISRLNNYEANAKKVDELPHQTTLEPSSKIPVSRAGISEHLTVQQIISSIQNSNYNQLLAVGTITVDGTDIIVPTGVSGQINGSLYGTSAETTIPITLCDAGFSRKDILVLTTSNTVIAISGEETDGAIVLAPPTPTDAVYITEFDVNDTTIGAPIDPILGTSFVKKSFSQPFEFLGTGADAVIPLNPIGYSEIRLTDASLTSISGVDLSLITGNPSAEVPYVGKFYIIYNLTGSDVTLKHNSMVADIPFLNRSTTDIVIPNNEIIIYSYDSGGLTDVFKSWIEVDLSTKADLVSGKVPAAQLPSYVDDVEEYANLASFPVTGETGKIYLALDTNKTYRWSGSAYVEIGGSAKKWENHQFSTGGNNTIPNTNVNAAQVRLFSNSVLSNLATSSTITETSGNINLAGFSDVAKARVTGNYTSKVIAIEFTYRRDVNESTTNTNVMISIMSDKRYNVDMQLIARYNLVSTTALATSETKVSIPVLSHLNLDPFSNLRWCIRSNNSTAQTFTSIDVNIITEEV